jgi:hypothetical protein
MVALEWASCNIRPALDLARHTAVVRMAAGRTAAGCKPRVLEQAMPNTIISYLFQLEDELIIQFRSMGSCLCVFSSEQ